MLKITIILKDELSEAMVDTSKNNFEIKIAESMGIFKSTLKDVFDIIASKHLNGDH